MVEGRRICVWSYMKCSGRQFGIVELIRYTQIVTKDAYY